MLFFEGQKHQHCFFLKKKPFREELNFARLQDEPFARQIELRRGSGGAGSLTSLLLAHLRFQTRVVGAQQLRELFQRHLFRLANSCQTERVVEPSPFLFQMNPFTARNHLLKKGLPGSDELVVEMVRTQIQRRHEPESNSVENAIARVFAKRASVLAMSRVQL